MPLFGLTHFLTIAAILLLAVLAIWLGWRDPSGRTSRAISWAIAGLLMIERVILLEVAARSGKLTLGLALPMHLCDWAVVVVILALIFRWRLAYVLAFFWGLAGTVQALITPDLAFDFPALEFFLFFGAHGLIVVGVLFLTLATPLRPQARDILVAFGWANFYAVCALAVNGLTGANYGYLRAKPIHPSLLDYLGPWPFYIVLLEMLSLLMFCLCYLPFAIADWREKAAT